MKLHFCQQGSEEWLALKLGRPTASEFHKIVTPGKADPSKTARSFAIRLVAEKLLNEQIVAFEQTEWMSRGKELELEAVRAYELQTDETTQQIGFVLADHGRYGASPDRLVGDAGLLEIKCPAPHTHLGYLLDGFDQDYRPQVQGQLLICEREWDDWISYHHIWPMVRVRAPRDEPYILKLKSALEQFCDLCDGLEHRARLLGLFPAPKKPVSAAAVALSQLDGEPALDALEELLPPELTVVPVETPVGPPRPREEVETESEPLTAPPPPGSASPDAGPAAAAPTPQIPERASADDLEPRWTEAEISGTPTDPAIAAWWAEARRMRSYHVALSSKALGTDGRDHLIGLIQVAPDVEALAAFQDANHRNISERISRASSAAANDVRMAIARRLSELNA